MIYLVSESCHIYVRVDTGKISPKNEWEEIGPFKSVIRECPGREEFTNSSNPITSF